MVDHNGGTINAIYPMGQVGGVCRVTILWVFGGFAFVCAWFGQVPASVKGFGVDQCGLHCQLGATLCGAWTLILTMFVTFFGWGLRAGTGTRGLFAFVCFVGGGLIGPHFTGLYCYIPGDPRAKGCCFFNFSSFNLIPYGGNVCASYFGKKRGQGRVTRTMVGGYCRCGAPFISKVSFLCFSSALATSFVLQTALLGAPSVV